ncbi:acetylglutamate kinase [Oceanobacillus sp. CAU 1775]
METVVLKVGGSVLEKLPSSFFETIVELRKSGKFQPVIVHGGGPEITQTLEKMNVKTEFVNGLRVTSEEVLQVVELVLSGDINKKIVTKIHKAGGVGLGLSGVDGALLKVKPLDPSRKLGFVGEVQEVNTSWIKLIIENDGIPVISPIGMDAAGQHYNVNGDTAAAAIAKSLGAKLALISDIPGVLEEISGEKHLHPLLTKVEIEEKIKTGIIYGGMIPKVKSALSALSGGVKESVILNGLVPEDLKAYIEGKQVGTKIVIGEVQHV